MMDNIRGSMKTDARLNNSGSQIFIFTQSPTIFGAQKHTQTKHNNKTKEMQPKLVTHFLMSYVNIKFIIYLANSRCKSFIALAH